MDIEFHYYIIQLLCKYAEIDEKSSFIISYSSQYVDSSIISHIISLPDGEYEGQITQNYGWWGDKYPKEIYIPYHFFPGDINYEGATRIDNKKNPYNTTPGSKNVELLLQEAFKSKNLYRIGIALHTYADSWAHQNFSGLNEDWNKINGTILPSIGHAEILSTPDRFMKKWIDTRLIKKNQFIDNKKRFLECAKNIYQKLCLFNNKTNDDTELVLYKLEMLIGSDEFNNDLKAKERILDYIINEDLLEYDKFEWINEAIHYNPNDFLSTTELNEWEAFEWMKDSLLYKTAITKKPKFNPRDNFFESNWYFWNEAAKEHYETAKKILNGLI